ncbi:MAG: hypothetical protein KGJ40_07140 [candidate division NC10 bacterium]|nr:hypothetical protein [candidate division NC10 bacterium]
MSKTSLLSSQKKWAGIACLTLLLAWVPQGAWGEPVTTIRNNGDSANRVDVAILGDGYTASELGKYATDVETFIQGFFAQEPFNEYQRYFNVHRVDVTSNQSGADHPELNPPVSVDTALDATYNCGGIQRLICVNISKVNGVVSSSLSSDRRDVILVIVNDTVYGGSGGAVAVASVNSAAVELILHEEGHSFGLLADEYGGPPPPSCNSSVEPPEVDATMQTQREQIKWNSWISPSTPVPTTGTAAGVPGLYEGAKYCDTGLYRPTYNSKMRSLNRPFEQINSEQLVKRVYNWVSPIDASEPSDSTVTLTQGQNQTFMVQVPQPSTHSLNIAWKVDGQTMGTSAGFTLISSSLTLGSHTVEVTVSDPTPLVRNDSAGVLKESRTWSANVIPGAFTLTVTMRGSGPGTVTSAPAGISCTVPGTCTTNFTSGTAVTLTEAPGSGASFKSWGGACSGTATTCTLTLTANQSVTATFSQLFTDPTLTARSTLLKAVHVTELRSAINTLRAGNGLAAFGWTDATLTTGTTPAKKVHLDELRTALTQAYQAAGQSAPSYTDPTLVAGSTVIKATHISELRTAVRALE